VLRRWHVEFGRFWVLRRTHRRTHAEDWPANQGSLPVTCWRMGRDGIIQDAMMSLPSARPRGRAPSKSQHASSFGLAR
jgi:hypothetical protein